MSKRELIYRNEENLRDKLDILEDRASRLQDILNPLFVLNKEKYSLTNLGIFAQNPKAFFIKMLIPNPQKVNGIIMDSEKVFDMLLLPTEVKEAMKKAEIFLKSQCVIYNWLDYLELKDNVFIITEKGKKRMEEINSIYIETTSQKAVFRALKNIKNELETIAENLPQYPQIRLGYFNDFFEIYPDGSPKNGKKVFDINYQFIEKVK